MKLQYLSILKTDGKGNAVELASAKELSSFPFLQRGKIEEFMKFASITVAGRTSAGQRQSVEEGQSVTYVYARQEGIAGVAITDKEYPQRVAFSVVQKALDDYLAAHPKQSWANATGPTAATAFPELDNYIRKYQDPHQADAIMKVQQELDDTKVVLHKTIDSVLQRGEKLDSLVDKSEALSSTSRMFYKQAKKTNSCCVVM